MYRFIFLVAVSFLAIVVCFFIQKHWNDTGEHVSEGTFSVVTPPARAHGRGIYDGDYDPIDVQDSKIETMCKLVAETLFNRKFVKVRMEQFTNPVTHKRLELDLYNADLGLAIEVQGQQHYNYVKYFHKTFQHFRAQQYRDEIKKMLCERNNIKLICVPYWLKSPAKIREFITTEARNLGYFV